MKKLPKCGVYVIKNILDDKVYIGGSVDLPARKRSHFKLLKAGTHYNSELQKDYSYLGSEYFEFQAIEECPRGIVRIREQYYISSITYKYNIDKTAKGPKVGNTRTKETKQKQRDAAVKRSAWNSLKRSIETKRKMIRDSEGNLFKSLTEAAKFWNITKATVCDVLKGRHNRTREGVRFTYE